ncbi:MAG: bifunctional diguanylate cyclase/phosphodiesterase [Pseudomonadota bacterium]|nr:bifunctional diguanylate cyclase/phosphodiesterase [Pseudomonadota bacterium]
MSRFSGFVPHRARAAGAALFGPPQSMAFLPAITLAAYWIGGEQALLVAALMFPLLYSLFGAPAARGQPAAGRGAARETVIALLDKTLKNPADRGLTTACLVVAVEGLDGLGERFGTPAAELAMGRVADRLAGALRGSDVVARLGEGCFAIALGAVRRADLETLLQIAGRLQDAVREPISIDATAAHLSSSVGFCLASRSPAADGAAMLAAAETAMRTARQSGPGAIRAFSAEMQVAADLRHDLADEVSAALESGQIVAWFQPQISTDTGAVTGFEALARWPQRERGPIPPSDFLGAIARAGLSERLSEEMLFNALSALRSWDKAGVHVPAVGVNFSGEELRNPRLVDKVRWELDRFGLTAERLTIEVLENVVSDAGDDMISRNISALSALGCGIDLDDFGTGHASIASVRRFAVGRLKIDRSFVTRVDQDREQQDMVAAILTMAEGLGLDTLAEGVETVGEHAMLAQLGCRHVQGFGIARPIPFEDTIAWMLKHQEKPEQAASLGRQAG